MSPIAGWIKIKDLTTVGGRYQNQRSKRMMEMNSSKRLVMGIKKYNTVPSRFREEDFVVPHEEEDSIYNLNYSNFGDRT